MRVFGTIGDSREVTKGLVLSGLAYLYCCVILLSSYVTLWSRQNPSPGAVL
jgi:hypothetical protein